MTLKGHYALCYFNGALMWLNGTSQGVGDGAVGQCDDDQFLWAVNSNHASMCSSLAAISNARLQVSTY